MQGDQTCAANQVLHGEATDLMAEIQNNSYYTPQVADPLDPVTFVNKITVPTFLACQWEDEQTGGQCPDLVQHFTGTNLKWFTFTNGAHIDSLDPDTFDRWYDFLELFVAHQAPIVHQAWLRLVARSSTSKHWASPVLVTLPADPIQLEPTYQAALAAFEALPEVRVLFDNGGGPSPSGSITPGDPYPAFEQSFASFPIPGTLARFWYLGPGVRSATTRRPRRELSPTTPTPVRCRLPTTWGTRAPAGCGPTLRRGSGTGSRTRLARPSHTCRRR